MRKQAQEHLDSMGIKTLKSVDLEVASLSGGQRQAIAVARSVFSDAKILLLDEPLAAMGVKEGAMILDLVRGVKEQGISVLIIAHNYGQVLEVCDRVNLLQGGQITYDKYARDTSVEELTEMVVAEYRKALEERHRAAASSYRQAKAPGRPSDEAPQRFGHDGGHVDVTPGRADAGWRGGADRGLAVLAGVTACTSGSAAVSPVGPGHREGAGQRYGAAG